MSVDVELVLDLGADLGESPVWDSRSSHLIFVDITAGAVYEFDPSTKHLEKIVVGQPVGAAVLADDGLIVTVRDGVAKMDKQGNLTFIADIERDRSGNQMNDAKCDPGGRLWAGTMAVDEEEGAGSLYCIDPDGTFRRVLTGTTISNGMAWTSDQTKMYYIDSPTKQVDIFDYDSQTGHIRNRRPFISCEEVNGLPDGMAIDVEDHLWVAFFYAGCVRRYSPSGELACVVDLPVTQPTSCTFGGPGLEELYITSAATGLDEKQRVREPHAGALFRCRPGVAGTPTVPFGGSAL